MGDFVKVILTGVSNTLLQPGYKDASLVAVGRTFCLRLNRFCNSFKRSRLRCRFFGLSNVRPSEHTASDLIPKSIPRVVSRCVGIGCIKIAQGTLQGLGVDFRKPLMLRLQLALHQIRQIYVAERFLTFLVCRDFQVERPVVIDKAAAAEGLGKQSLLLACRIDSIFVGT